MHRRMRVAQSHSLEVPRVGEFIETGRIVVSRAVGVEKEEIGGDFFFSESRASVRDDDNILEVAMIVA